METNQIKKIKRDLHAYIDAQGDWEYWLARWKEIQAGPSAPKLSGLPGGTSDGTQVERQAETRAACKRQLDAAKDAKDAALAQVCKLIAMAPTVQQRNVLRMRYLQNLTWEEIAERANRSRQRITTIHGNALDSLRAAED